MGCGKPFRFNPPQCRSGLNPPPQPDRLNIVPTHCLPYGIYSPPDGRMPVQVGPKHDIIFMITKMGYLFLFDIHSGKALYRAKISEQTIFVTTTQVRK